MAALGEYNHTESIAATVWTVAHGLGTVNVTVDVIMLNGADLEKVMPLSIVVVDINTVKITFSSAQSGNARIVGGGE